MKKSKVKTTLHIFNAVLDVDFDAEILPDGSLRMEYHDAIIIPKGHFEFIELRNYPDIKSREYDYIR